MVQRVLDKNLSTIETCPQQSSHLLQNFHTLKVLSKLSKSHLKDIGIIKTVSIS